MRVAVVGHVEWCEFAVVPHVPRPGDIVHAAETFEEAAGGGAVAAVQLRKLAGAATLFTAFGDDETGHRSEAELREHGVHVEGCFHPEPQRRAFVHLDSDGERTITVLGPRLGPSGADDLPWDLLDETDAVYVTAGDIEAARQARRAPCARGHGARARHAGRGARRSWTRWCRAGGTPASATAPATSTLRRRSWCGRSERTGESGRRRAASRAAGARESCPVRFAIPTAVATALRPASRTDSAPAGASEGGRARRALRCRLPHRPGPLRGPASARELSQATCPSTGSIGRPSLTHACSPPSRLCASKPAAANACAASADLLPERQ